MVAPSKFLDPFSLKEYSLRYIMERQPETGFVSEAEKEMRIEALRYAEEAFELQDEKYGKLFIYEKENGETKEKLNPNYLAYHNGWHTRGVAEGVKHIFEALVESGMNISEKEALLAFAAAAHHDLVLTWNEEKLENGSRLRRFDRGQNEEQTAQDFKERLIDLNKREGREVCSEREIERAKEMIMVTVPDFSPEAGTVVQKNLSDQSEVSVRALALADLGDAGMFGPGRFISGGQRLFREENIDIAGAYIEDLSDNEKTGIMKRMIRWANFQEVFASGRQKMFEAEIAPLPESSKQALRKLFNTFDESIKVAHMQAEKFSEVAEMANISVNQRFMQSLEAFGYKIEEKNGKGWILP